jgi:hypothetical protein
MKKMIEFSLRLAICLTACLGTGCSVQGFQTVLWRSDGNYLVASTNDSARCGTWMTRSVAHETTMTSVAIELSHVTGNAEAPFGVRFCSMSADTFYYFYIDAQHNYKIGKQISGYETVIKDWTVDGSLQGGSTFALVKITNEGGGSFSITNGGSPLTTFIDTGLSGGDVAFAAYIMPVDKVSFPQTPEEFRFSMSLPQIVR